MHYWVYPNPLPGTSGCLILSEGTALADLPLNIRGRYGAATASRIIELNPAVKYAGLDVEDVLRDIAETGYFITGVPSRTIEQWPGIAWTPEAC